MFPDQPWGPCLGVIQTAGSEISSVWARTAVILDVYNPSSQMSPRESPVEPLKRKLREHAQPSPRSPKRRRMSPNGRVAADSPQARLSPCELEEGWWAPRQPDDDLQSNVDRIVAATGNRRHVLGMYVRGLKIRFYLYDHAGTIYTTSLDLRKDAQRIVASVISISFLDSAALGLEPILKPKTSMSPAELFSKAADCYIEVDGTSFYCQSLLHAPTIFGRGTVVYEAIPAGPDSTGSPVLSNEADVPAEVVLKLSWQLPSSNSEEEMLKVAAERGVQGIARLYRSATVCRLSEGLRGRLVPAKLYADRELRVQVTGPRATLLAEVEDLETFKTAFRSLVTGASLEHTHFIFVIKLKYLPQLIVTSTRKLAYYIAISVSAT